MVLEKINQPNDIKSLTDEELKILASEIREFLIEKISVTGGHLASNLGVVELTMALHLALDLPKDKIIWDVGHQSYTHKLLILNINYQLHPVQSPWHRADTFHPVHRLPQSLSR